jgi:UDP-N-acetylglucosamine--N-acetylmuramyl-(pentapeptide) pyrophosphoryl-undecaprenol N-acetylglucosamine transferase
MPQGERERHDRPSGTRPRRVAIAGGGTAGHVTPALAIAEAYRRAVEVDLLFLGGQNGFESRLVPQAGYRLERISAAPLFGVGLTGKVKTVSSLLRGMVEARRRLKAHRTELLIGLGGYASAGAVLAGRTLGIRTAIHEANALPGRTNRFLARFADRIYLGFATAAAAFPRERTRLVGIPVRSDITHLAAEERTPPSPRDRAARVLVTGGSQGARFLNQQAPELLAALSRGGVAVEAWHQVGDGESEPVRAGYTAGGVAARVEGYIEDMARAYRWADIALTRAGACTIAELALAGLPAFLVPLPTASDDHQTANAMEAARFGAAAWVSESAWQAESLAAEMTRLLGDRAAYTAASDRMRRLARPQAAGALVSDCEDLLARGGPSSRSE